MRTLFSAVPGWEGDNVYYVRSMWWVKRALFDLHRSPSFDPTTYYPIGYETARSELTAANTWLGLGLTIGWGPVVAYNVMILFSFFATGLGTCLWVRRLTDRSSAGLLAGTVAALLPFRFAHLSGHLPLVCTQWIPWTLYGFECFLERRSLARATGLGVAAALVALSCWYYGYALMVMLPAYAIARTWRSPVWRERAWWRGAILGASVALVVVLPFLIPAAQLQRRGQLTRSIAEMDAASLNPYDFFVPNLLHPMFGSAAARWFPGQRATWVERGVALGYVATLLALVGLLWGRPRHIVSGLLVVWLLAYLIALGPTLHFLDSQVVVRGWLVPLPSMFMFYVLPGASSMRVMARFGLWTGFATAALAGCGLIHLSDSARRRWGPHAATVCLAAAIAAVVFESMTTFAMLRVAPREVDRWLAQQPAGTVIVEMPLEQGVRPMQNYWATQHGRAEVFGWNGSSFNPPEYASRTAALRDFPLPESVEFLRALGVTYVLLRPNEIGDWEFLKPVLDEAPGLRMVRTLGETVVYRVLAD